jgi:hypothetical protein
VSPQRGEVVRQRRRRPAQPDLKPADLSNPLLDPEYVGRLTYLTVPQLMVYGQFQTKKAAYGFLARSPSIRRGHGRIFRRDVDLVLQSRERDRRAGQSAQTSGVR